MSQVRDGPLRPGAAALLIIDVQNYFCKPGFGFLQSEEAQQKNKYLIDRVYNTLVPSIQPLLGACRKQKNNIKVVYTFVECLTQDGSDQCVNYKIIGFLVPKDSDGAKIISEIAPIQDEILLPKTACNVFNTTKLEYILRNFGVSQLVVTGMVTNQCVEAAVRDAADLGFLVTLVEDACAAFTPEDHQSALHNLQGTCRIVSHDQVVAEINGWTLNKVSPEIYGCAHSHRVKSPTLTWGVALIPDQSALLVIDLQEYHRKPEHQGNIEKSKYMLDRLNATVLPNMQRLLRACRAEKGKAEVIYTLVECLSKDCRDQSLNYLISRINVPKGSPGAKIMHEVAPEEDELVIPRSSLSVFNSTNIDYVLKNLGVSQLVIAGMLTNQAVEAAVIGAFDRGFLVSFIEDACAAHSEVEHQSALRLVVCGCRIVTTDQVISEIAAWK